MTETTENTGTALFDTSAREEKNDMPLDLSVPKHQPVVLLTPKITVVGVGGGGGNAINNMVDAKLEGITFIACNTDAQALNVSKADVKIQIGVETTKGQGSGAIPEVGKESAEENLEEITKYLEDTNMLFITAGMGGGTGTGAAPVIAKAAHDRGILTVGVVTKPFHFEGKHRMATAERGIDELAQFVDTLIVIPNQNLFLNASEKTTFSDAFKLADQVLQDGVRSVTDLILLPGIINLDFADIRTIMSEMGRAMMGTGEASGENRALDAAEKAISNPLLENNSMIGSKGILINISGGEDITLFEVDEAVNRIRREVDPDANIIFGAALDPAMDGFIRVSVVATGITRPEEAQSPFMSQTASPFSSAFSKPAVAPAQPSVSTFSMLRKQETPEPAPAPVETKAPEEPEAPVSDPEPVAPPPEPASVLHAPQKPAPVPSFFTPKTVAPSEAIPSMPSAHDLFASAGADIFAAPVMNEPAAPVFPETSVFAEQPSFPVENEPAVEQPAPEPEPQTVAEQDDLFPNLPPPVVPSSARSAERSKPKTTSLWKRVTSFIPAERQDETPSVEPEAPEISPTEDDLDIPAFLRH